MWQDLTIKLKISKWRPELVGLVIVSFFTRFWNLFSPNSVVFDEVYFKMFAAHYLDHRYYFDIHPPLAKLMLALQGTLFGMNANTMLNTPAVALRVMPALAGAMLAPLVWGILRRLRVNRWIAFLGAAAILLDTALLVESKFILMDSTLMLFGMAGVYFYLVARDTHTTKRMLFLTLAVLSAGAAASIKWTGLTSIAIIALIWLYDARALDWTNRVKQALVIVLVPTLVYVGSFWLHFALLPKSGDGDAFMTSKFQQTLQGGPVYDANAKMGFWSKFIELNNEMYQANRTLTATHPYGSKWYTWPVDIRPVYYWQGPTLKDGSQGNIYLLGNPLIWWGVLATIALGVFYAYKRRVKFAKGRAHVLLAIIAAYLMNYLPFIPVPRVMFIYHYFFAFVYSIIFAAVLWDSLIHDEETRLPKRVQQIFFVIVAATMLIGFAYFMPLAYGLPLSPEGLQNHVWLTTWR
jgi:dolichyl-phosphate-mannose-protein mannosyltransferase